MACIFLRNSQGEIIDVRKPDSSPSELFRNAFNKFGDRQQAIDIAAIGYSEVFQQETEPSLNDVLFYISKTNGNQRELSAQQKQDLKSSLMAFNVSDIDEARIKLNKAFYNSENIFLPTLSSLTNSGLYSQYETQTILNDISLQERIKSALEGLNNTDYNEEEYAAYNDLADINEKLSDFNSFGKLNTINPYVVRQNILDNLADPPSRVWFDDNLQNLEYQNINPEALYQEMQEYKRAEEWADIDGNIVTSIPQTDTLSLLEQTKKVTGDLSAINNIQYILDLSDEVIADNNEQVSLILDAVEQNMLNEGLNVIGLNSRVNDENLKTFLSSLEQFLLTPTEGITQNFVNEYNKFFEVDTTPRTVVLKPSDLNRNYVYLRTTKSEEELLSENSILKVKADTFIKVRRQPLDRLYSILNITPTEVQQRISELENVVNPDLAEELILNKIYFNLPINPQTEINYSEQQNNNEVFESVTEDFVSDFYIAGLKEKYKDSPLWKNFYNNFEVTATGLNMIYSDPISIDNMKSWMQEISKNLSDNLTNYSISSKNMPSLANNFGEDIIDTLDSQRALAVNYPETVEKVSSESVRINEDIIIAKNNLQQFIRVGNEVYESYETADGLNMFVKLPPRNPNFNQYKITPSKTEFKLKDYQYLSTINNNILKERSYLNKEQRNQINNENFNCL